MSIHHLLELFGDIKQVFAIVALGFLGWKFLRNAYRFYKTLTRPGHLGQAAPGGLKWLCKFLASRGRIHTWGGSWYRGPKPKMDKPGKGLLHNSF